MIEGSPLAVGFVRAPEFDHFVKQGRFVWRTPENVLLVLPEGCAMVRLLEVKTPRGVTLACIFPEGVNSLWPTNDPVRNYLKREIKQ